MAGYVAQLENDANEDMQIAEGKSSEGRGTRAPAMMEGHEGSGSGAAADMACMVMRERVWACRGKIWGSEGRAGRVRGRGGVPAGPSGQRPLR